MKKSARTVLGFLAVLAAGSIFAADWPQWRGPERNGLAPQSPALIDQFPETGPKKLWQSDDLFDKGAGGNGSAAVADGKVYVFVDWLFDAPIDERTLSRNAMNQWGYSPDMPAELSKAVEEVRVSDARKALKGGQATDDWVNAWIKENLKPEQRKFQGAVQARLRGGPNAVPLDVLAKLAAIVDRKFENQATLDKWFADNGIDDTVKKLIMRGIPQTKKDVKDAVFCLEAATGKTLWKRDLPGQVMGYAGASTPTVVDGKCWIETTDSKVHCLDAKTGNELWSSEPLGKQNNHNRSSSVLIVDGLAVVVTEGRVAALDAASGKFVWFNDKVKNEASSAVVWRSGDRTCLLCNGVGMTCLDAKDGTKLWSVPCQDRGVTPAVSGDTMVFAGGDKVGLIAYKLALDKPTQLWAVPFSDSFTSPVVLDGCVYAAGCANEDKGKGRFVCVDLNTGKVQWEDVGAAVELSNPIIAGGKLFAVAGQWLYMVKASPDKYALLGKANLGLDKWASPAIADGKLYLRTAKKLLCFDVSKQP